MNKPNIKGFQISQDYGILWKLIHSGHRIPCWLKPYPAEFLDVWDLVEAHVNKYGRLLLGVRGTGYEPFDNTLEAFESVCSRYHLWYAIPDEQKGGQQG